MLIYSHRGESLYAPENTMSAFYLAYLLNSDGIECDIRKTKDNQLVIIHDKTINRTSNAVGKVSEYTLEELYNFDFGINKGERIVTLIDFLNYFSNKKIKIFLEIKESGYEKLIWDIISKYEIKNITIISFHFETLKKFRNLSDILNLGLLVYEVNKKMINETKEYNIDTVICISAALNKNNVLQLQKNNIKVYAWGIKNKLELMRMEELKVDGIVYDSYYDARKVLNNEK